MITFSSLRKVTETVVIFPETKLTSVLFIHLNRPEVLTDLEHSVWIVIGKNSEISHRIHSNASLKISVNNIEIPVIKFGIVDSICNTSFMCNPTLEFYIVYSM